MLYNPRVFNKLTIDNYTEVVQGIFDKNMIEIVIVGWKNIYGME